MRLKSVKEIKNLKGKKVLLRVEFNVPLSSSGKNWVVADDRRIIESLPTIKYLLKNGCSIALLSWLGRPDGKVVDHLKMDPVAKHLSKLLKKPVKKLNDCVGPKVFENISKLKAGQIVMLENVRFYKEEMAEDKLFSALLTHGFDLVVFDAFGTIHRVHSSTTGITKILPSYAGLLMEKEVSELSKITSHPKKPLVVILGGAKISDKLHVLKSMLKIADKVLIGGGLANAFLKAKRIPIGKSFLEDTFVDGARRKKTSPVVQAKKLLKKYPEKIVLPVDMIAGNKINQSALVEVVDFSTGGKIHKRWKFLDIGPKTIENYLAEVKKAKTIFFNGPMGVTEIDKFASGSKKLAQAVARSKAITVLGGGDTELLAQRYNLIKKYNHVSTGGGASMAFVAGETLPVLKKLIK